MCATCNSYYNINNQKVFREIEVRLKMEKKNNLGRILHIIREKSEMTVNFLSEKTGISTTSIISIEKGRSKPTISTLMTLSEALQVPVADILIFASTDKNDFTAEDKIRLFDMLID